MVNGETRYEVRLSRGVRDIHAAQRLRYDVFATELGASGPSVDHENRIEADEYDDIAEHLLLVDLERESEGRDYVLGAYRLLNSDRLSEAGAYYSENEFDLSGLKASGRKTLELGRSCIHKDVRGGIALQRLWTSLARYVLDHEIEILFGVASFHGTDPEQIKAPLAYLMAEHQAPKDLAVRALDISSWMPNADDAVGLEPRDILRSVPSLIKAYLRLGGFVGQGAFIDRDFNTIDVCLIMDRMRMDERQRRYYTAKAGYE